MINTTAEQPRTTILRGDEHFVESLKSFLSPILPGHVGTFEIHSFNDRFSLELIQQTRVIDSRVIGPIYDQAQAFQCGYRARDNKNGGLNNG